MKIKEKIKNVISTTLYLIWEDIKYVLLIEGILLPIQIILSESKMPFLFWLEVFGITASGLFIIKMI
jgi:hypothetical protein